MAYYPCCGKEVTKPSNVLKNQYFTIEAYDCDTCHHRFKVTANQTNYIV